MELVAGPWVRTTYGYPNPTPVVEWARTNANPNANQQVLAAVYTGDPKRNQKPLWVALPKEVWRDAKPSKLGPRQQSMGFVYTHTEDSIEEAKVAADKMLKHVGYILESPREEYLEESPRHPLESRLATPWMKKVNHWCRDMMLGSLRPPTAHSKIAVLREMGSQWVWVVLSVHAETSVQQGREITFSAAQRQADSRLTQCGWDLLESPDKWKGFSLHVEG